MKKVIKLMGGVCLTLLILALQATAHKVNCDVPESDDRNISLTSLSQPFYEGSDMESGRTLKKIYISVCQPFGKLPSNLSSICDPQSHVCITQLDDGLEEEYIPNAGKISEKGVFIEKTRLVLELDSGEVCPENTSKNISTRIDFFCNFNYANENSILYGGVMGGCTHQVFWHTSLACKPGQTLQPVPSSCFFTVPGYDAQIDLKVWSSPAGYYLARSADDQHKNKFYHLNLCKSLSNSPCPSDSVVCEVDDTETKVLKTFANFTDTSTLSYNENKEVIRFRYPKKFPDISVNINIECDQDALEPQITMEHLDDKIISFRFFTISACLIPPVQCQARNDNKDLYDLSSLRSEEWEFSLADDKQTMYEIKVCGSLPITQNNPCSGQAGICSYRYEGNTTKMVDAKNLGIMYKRPTVLDNGYIRLDYSHGSTYDDGNGNRCNMSAEIILRCDEKEYGPQFEEATACKHTITWATPVACPQKQVTSTDCTVREPLFNNLFNLTNAHNRTTDYTIQGKMSNYTLNVCGDLVSSCDSKAKDTMCLDTSQSLTYMDGFLELKYEPKTCDINPKKTLNSRIIFTCDHEAGVGRPELVDEDECQLEFSWASSLACPPHYMVQCSVRTSKGFVDLSSLSLPHENYQVSNDNGDLFVLNLCRSLVHTNQTKCPYKSASCLIKQGDELGQNLGQVHNSLKVDDNDVPYITYTLGSVCSDKDSTLTHLHSVIKFECTPGLYDSLPEFVEFSNCHYIFLWKHAVACPVQTASGNCSVTSPASGFTFNLTSLNRPDGWRWNESSHHLLNHIDMNVCGPLTESACGAGTGVCDNNKINLGLANSNLTYTDSRLELVYPGGNCPGQPEVPAETKIRFNCPPRRDYSSGNQEPDGPWRFTLKKTSTSCVILIDFVTDLACDHQVYCDVTMDNVVYPLTKLRHHDVNYQMVDADGNHFLLNVCGPLVATDVPSSGCNPQGACGFIDNRYIGLGKVQSSPYVTGSKESRQLMIRYTDGDHCEANNGTWSSNIFFICDASMDHNSRFGTPQLIGVDDKKCEVTFQMTTRLACQNVTKDVEIREPDSCRLYHPGKDKYIDISPLHSQQNYKIYTDGNLRDYFELQPCGSLVSSCNASICKVIPSLNTSLVLGNMFDVRYYPDSDWLRVKYVDGFVCNQKTGNKFVTKIFYICDPSVDGVGYPELEENGVMDCNLIINWRSKAICDQIEIDQYEKNHANDDKNDWDDNDDSTSTNTDYDNHGDDDADTGHAHDHSDQQKEKEEEEDGGGGSAWGYVVAIVLLLCLGIYVYRSNNARDNLARILTEVRARMPVFMGGRAHRDSTFLISGYNAPNSGNGFLDDDDDYT